MAATMSLIQAEELFELPDPYGKDDVKDSYRRLIREKHPDVRHDVDKETANREASEINAANKLLSSRFASSADMKYFRQKSASQAQGTGNTTGGTQAQPQPATVEVPIEQITWEDLISDLQQMYNDISANKMIYGYYTTRDLKRDVAVNAAAWAAGKAAKKMDERAAEKRKPSDPVELECKAEKKKIDRRSGRVAIFIYSFLIFYAISCVLAACGQMTGGVMMVLAAIAWIVPIFNAITLTITNAMRKRPYKKLAEKYGDVFSATS